MQDARKLKSVSTSGVLAGFFVVVATSIMLSILSPFIFSKLVRTGDLDVLMTSAGPLSYALVVLFISAAFGVFTCQKVANSSKIINTTLVVLLYALFSYWLSNSPSNANNPYPQWYVLMSYVILVPGAFVGNKVYFWLHESA